MKHLFNKLSYGAAIEVSVVPNGKALITLYDGERYADAYLSRAQLKALATRLLDMLDPAR